MAFDDIPEDTRASYPCPDCPKGDVTLNVGDQLWECNSCDFIAENEMKN